MSLPVFVRNALLLLWKLDVKLKNSPSLAHCREKSVHKGEPGLIPNAGRSGQTVSDDARPRPGLRQRHAGGPGTSYYICSVNLVTFIIFSPQVDDVDISYRPPRKEEVPSHAGLSCWNSFSPSAFDSKNCSQNPYPPSPDHHEPRESRAPGLDNPRMSSPSPFASSPSFPSSPQTSLCLSEEAQRRQPQTYSPLSPGLNCRGCSLTDANVGLR